jgi:hypothetical protein
MNCTGTGEKNQQQIRNSRRRKKVRESCSFVFGIRTHLQETSCSSRITGIRDNPKGKRTTSQFINFNIMPSLRSV